MSWFVYLLRCADGSLYCGTSTDLGRRVEQHNAGKGAKYTRSRRPVRILGSRLVASKSEALKLEYQVKQLPASEKFGFLVSGDRG